MIPPDPCDGGVSGWGGCGARGRERMVVGIWLAVPAGSRPEPPAKSQPPTRQRPGRFCAIKASRKTGPDAFLKDGRFLKEPVLFLKSVEVPSCWFYCLSGRTGWLESGPPCSPRFAGSVGGPDSNQPCGKAAKRSRANSLPKLPLPPQSLTPSKPCAPSGGSGGDDPPRRGPGQRPGGEVQERQRLSWWGLGQRPSSSSFFSYFATAMRPSSSNWSGSCAPSHATMRSATAMPSASTSRPFLPSMV